MEDHRTIDEIFCGGKYDRLRRLANETGARLPHAIAAMKDSDYDLESARELLKQRDQVMTPEKRRAERRAWREWKIKDLEESKPGWRQFYLDKVAEAEEKLAKLREEQEQDV